MTTPTVGAVMTTMKLPVAAASRTIDAFALPIPEVIVVFALSEYRITALVFVPVAVALSL